MQHKIDLAFAFSAHLRAYISIACSISTILTVDKKTRYGLFEVKNYPTSMIYPQDFRSGLETDFLAIVLIE